MKTVDSTLVPLQGTACQLADPIKEMYAMGMHAAGWTLDAPTPSQLKEFFGQIDSGEITKDRLQTFLDGGSVEIVIRLTETEQIAADILGPGKVIGYNGVISLWHAYPPEAAPTMPFSEKTLWQCAAENKQGADWRVVYIRGYSLHRLSAIRGHDCKKQPCFDSYYSWWLEVDQYPFVTMKKIEAGYRLLDFSMNLRNMPWKTQENEIAKRGNCYERAEEQAVAEACFSNYLLSRKKERLLDCWWHWGHLLPADGYHVSVGYLFKEGISVDYCWHDNHRDDLAVVLSRKF